MGLACPASSKNVSSGPFAAHSRGAFCLESFLCTHSRRRRPARVRSWPRVCLLWRPGWQPFGRLDRSRSPQCHSESPYSLCHRVHDIEYFLFQTEQGVYVIGIEIEIGKDTVVTKSAVTERIGIEE